MFSDELTFNEPINNIFLTYRIEKSLKSLKFSEIYLVGALSWDKYFWQKTVYEPKCYQNKLFNGNKLCPNWLVTTKIFKFVHIWQDLRCCYGFCNYHRLWFFLLTVPFRHWYTYKWHHICDGKEMLIFNSYKILSRIIKHPLLWY